MMTIWQKLMFNERLSHGCFHISPSTDNRRAVDDRGVDIGADMKTTLFYHTIKNRQAKIIS